LQVLIGVRMPTVMEGGVKRRRKGQRLRNTG
jgi:hypothetical protein